MGRQPNISQNNEKILDDIQMLQQMEQNLFNNLETNTSLTPQQKQEIVEKMNQISNMRINLYQTLSGVNNFFENALSSSVGTLREQSVAIGIVENELNHAKKSLEALESEKNNKIRLVEINDYYGDRYAEHSKLMKIIIFTLVPVIILAILNNKGFLPSKIYYILLIIVCLIGAYFFWRTYFSIFYRDNMNYQEYNWSFNPANAVKGTEIVGPDPWLSNINLGTCIGQQCCSHGQKWDASLNQCVGTSTVESFVTNDMGVTNDMDVTEGMIEKMLTKVEPGKYKSDYVIGTHYEAPMSNSFINNSGIK
jgi:hypothetical protein